MSGAALNALVVLLKCKKLSILCLLVIKGHNDTAKAGASIKII